jgi:tRNA threonylcarbamoyladenosine biosynthesis protein TsaE
MSPAETVISRSPEETQAIGARLGARLRPGAVIACTGELGAGKTCFLQGLARGLGVASDVTSPTFVLVNQYRGRLPVYHLDAYRTGSLTELVDLGLEEMLHGDGVTVIEWADKLLPLLPVHTIHVHLSGLGDEPREIRIEE